MRGIRNKSDISSRQLTLKKKHKLSDQQFTEMLALLAELTPAERATLETPDFITEDEADLIVNDRNAKEPGKRVSAEELFAEFGYTPRRRSA